MPTMRAALAAQGGRLPALACGTGCPCAQEQDEGRLRYVSWYTFPAVPYPKSPPARPGRYFLSPAEASSGEFAGLEPGRLSGDLRAALGIGRLDPPPWLQRMRELGYPPGWQCARHARPCVAAHARSRP